jgi:hypothetical protein
METPIHKSPLLMEKPRNIIMFDGKNMTAWWF